MKKTVVILLIFFVMVSATGGFLLRLQGSQKLGKPGLKMVDRLVFDETGGIVNTNTIDLPEEVPGYDSMAMPVSLMELGWLPKDTTYGRRKYKALDHFEATASVVLMGTDRGSIHKPQFCLGGQGWKIQDSKVEKIQIESPQKYELQAMKILATKTWTPPGQNPIELSSVYVYWFVADNQLTPYHGERMWWMARDLLKTGILQRWAYVSYLTICLPGKEEAAFQRLSRLIARTVPEFQLAKGAPIPEDSRTALLP